MNLIDELTKNKMMTTGQVIKYYRRAYGDKYKDELEKHMAYCEYGNRIAIQSALGMETTSYKRYEPIHVDEAVTVD